MEKKADLSMEYLAAILILLGLLVILLIFSGVFREKITDLLGKFFNFIIGK